MLTKKWVQQEEKDAKYMCHMISLLADMAELPVNLCWRVWKKSSVPFCSSLTSDIFPVKYFVLTLVSLVSSWYKIQIYLRIKPNDWYIDLERLNSVTLESSEEDSSVIYRAILVYSIRIDHTLKRITSSI